MWGIEETALQSSTERRSKKKGKKSSSSSIGVPGNLPMRPDIELRYDDSGDRSSVDIAQVDWDLLPIAGPLACEWRCTVDWAGPLVIMRHGSRPLTIAFSSGSMDGAIPSSVAQIWSRAFPGDRCAPWPWRGRANGWKVTLILAQNMMSLWMGMICWHCHTILTLCRFLLPPVLRTRQQVRLTKIVLFQLLIAVHSGWVVGKRGYPHGP